MKIRSKNKIAIYSLLVCLMLMLGVGADAKESKPKTLKIGGIVMLSGPASQAGLAFSRGWQILVDKVNDEGGLKIGNDTYKIKLIIEDDKMSPEGAATAATKLVYQDNVKFVIGGLADFLKMSICRITDEAGALYSLTHVEASGVLKNPVDVGPGKFRIRVGHAYNETFIGLFDYLVENYPEVKTIGLATDGFPDHEVFIPESYKIAKKYGLSIVGEPERIPPDATDFYSFVARILKYNPDAIYNVAGGPNFPGMILKMARELRFEGPIFYSIQCDPAMQRRIAGPNSTKLFGAGLTSEGPDVSPAIMEFIERYKKKYSLEEFMTDSINAYDGLWVLIQTIQKAQSVDPKDVLKTYETLTKPGSLQTTVGPAHVGGLKTFGVNRVLVKPLPVSCLINGKAKSVTFFTPYLP